MFGLLASLLLTAVSPQQHVTILAQFSDAPTAGPGEVHAELIAVPDGTTAVAYADQLVRQDVVQPFGPSGRQSGLAGPLRYELLNGRGSETVAIFSLVDGSNQSPKVCRVRSTIPGLNEPQGAANRWCARQLGVAVQEGAAAIIGRQP